MFILSKNNVFLSVDTCLEYLLHFKVVKMY